jgi:hypothetical protein
MAAGMVWCRISHHGEGACGKKRRPWNHSNLDKWNLADIASHSDSVHSPDRDLGQAALPEHLSLAHHIRQKVEDI